MFVSKVGDGETSLDKVIACDDEGGNDKVTNMAWIYEHKSSEGIWVAD